MRWPWAEPLLARALEFRRNTLGESHPHTADSLAALGRLALANKNPSRAEELYKEALDIHLRLLDRTADVQTEYSQIAFANAVRYVLEGYLRAAAENGRSPAGDAYAMVLRWKGQVFTRQRRQRELALAAADPKSAAGGGRRGERRRHEKREYGRGGGACHGGARKLRMGTGSRA